MCVTVCLKPVSVVSCDVEGERLDRHTCCRPDKFVRITTLSLHPPVNDCCNLLCVTCCVKCAPREQKSVGVFVFVCAAVTSQQHASVFQGRICPDKVVQTAATLHTISCRLNFSGHYVTEWIVKHSNQQTVDLITILFLTAHSRVRAVKLDPRVCVPPATCLRVKCATPCAPCERQS